MYKTELTKEYLKDRFIDKKWSYSQIYEETGWSKCTINKKIGDFKIRRKKCFKTLDLIGKKFGELTIFDRAKKIKRSVYWKCRCDCGNEIQSTTGNLLSGNTTSCGCKKSRKGEEHPAWRGKGQISGRYWHMLKGNSLSRGIFFNLTIDYIWELLVSQNHKCALSGRDIIIAADSSQTASLDRIDSSKGYIVGNLQWLHKDVNRAKNVMPQTDFVKMCQNVVANLKNNEAGI